MAFPRYSGRVEIGERREKLFFASSPDSSRGSGRDSREALAGCLIICCYETKFTSYLIVNFGLVSC